MPKLRDVCRNVRSKNAGPFWVTIDIFFDGEESFRRHSQDPAISAHAIATRYCVDPSLVKHFEVAELMAVKISYPRKLPQGGVIERDMHSGQQYVELLDVQLTWDHAGNSDPKPPFSLLGRSVEGG